MIEELRNKRNMIRERLLIALSTKNARLADDLLVQFNSVHWLIVAIEDQAV